MKLSEIGVRRLLQVASGLVIVGLLLEIVSLIWFHPHRSSCSPLSPLR